MMRSSASVAMWCALSLTGCSCDARFHSLDDRVDEDGALDPHPNDGGGRARGEGGGGAQDGRDAQVAGENPMSEGEELVDPQPVEVDRSGLIRTSGSHAVVLTGTPFDGVARRLIAVDLERDDFVELAENDALSFAHASPDGSSILFGGHDRTVADHFYVTRLLDEGVVPAVPVAGFADDRGDRQVLGWTEDGRFALLSRYSLTSEHGIDLVDARRGARQWSTESDSTSEMSGSVAPRGLWFSYAISGQGASSGIGRITADGIHQVAIPELDGVAAYGPNGTRIAYVPADQAGPARAFYRDLRPGAQAQAFEVDALQVDHPVMFLHDDDHVLVRASDRLGLGSLHRIDLRSGATTEVDLPGVDLDFWASNDGSSLLAFDTAQAMTHTDLWLVDTFGDEHSVVVETFPRMEGTWGFWDRFTFGCAGPEHFWYFHDGHDLTFVARAGDGSAARRVVSEPQDSAFDCLPQPPLDGQRDEATRVAARVGQGAALILIDLADPLAESVARIEAPHGGQIDCPMWNVERSALAFVERVGTEPPFRSYLYTVHWPAPGGSTLAEPAFEAELALRLVAYRP